MNKLISGSPTSHDLFLFHEGSLFQAYRMLGSRLTNEQGQEGVSFAVWAPHAVWICVVGDFNGWQGAGYAMNKLPDSGVWSLFIPGLQEGTVYKYEIHTKYDGLKLKSDPYAVFTELRPHTASIVQSLDKFTWQDHDWQQKKKQESVYKRPMLIYEVHLGSWRFNANQGYLTYEQLADELVEYVCAKGFTHIELLPLSEHPFDRSWGYQITGYFSLTSRYGTPEQFMHFVNRCHQRGIGVIMDWVPGHFCKDDPGLRRFDGSPLFEYADPKKAEKPLWGTMSFDFGKPEVQCFLISNAIFWMDVYHIDGLRVDAVASMMDLNFDKPREQWTFNEHGGTVNLESLQFIKKLNTAIFHYFPEALMIAEDSSDTAMVTAPIYSGGLGFNYKWNMGWMNDILRYMQLEVDQRRYHHHLITFSFHYTYSENFILPFSHDEVVHGKKSLLNKMPGDYWRKFANLRLLLGFMHAHPGKKLLFMGSEFAQFDEWKDLEQLDWDLERFEMHRKFRHYFHKLNHLYLAEPALWELDHHPKGFGWLDANNNEQSILSFIRKSSADDEFILVVCNFTAEVHHHYRIGVPLLGRVHEIWNSDEEQYGGSGQVNGSGLTAESVSFHGQPFSITLTIPPLATMMLKSTPI